MSHDTSWGRRRFLGNAAATVAAAKLGMVGSARAQSTIGNPARAMSGAPEPHALFGPLKQVDAGVLNVGYAEAGPANGPPVILLHGWPYDIHSFVEVSPLLAKEGFRVIVPHLRGYGTTRFLSGTTMRNGQQAAVALDIVALMDVLAIERARLAGFDWGARTANGVAALRPRSSSGRPLRRRGTSTTPRSTAARRRSTIPTMWPS